jgi:hypothetical protein
LQRSCSLYLAFSVGRRAPNCWQLPDKNKKQTHLKYFDYLWLFNSLLIINYILKSLLRFQHNVTKYEFADIHQKFQYSNLVSLCDDLGEEQILRGLFLPTIFLVD